MCLLNTHFSIRLMEYFQRFYHVCVERRCKLLCFCVDSTMICDSRTYPKCEVIRNKSFQFIWNCLRRRRQEVVQIDAQSLSHFDSFELLTSIWDTFRSTAQNDYLAQNRRIIIKQPATVLRPHSTQFMRLKSILKNFQALKIMRLKKADS